MIYYGSRISDNLSTSPEGFLICHNVPIARTGYQDYLGSEFPSEMQEEYGINPQKVYKVYRSADEVFSPATIASFEGKPFTDNHPAEMVTTHNINMYGKGHIQNIRKGVGEYQNMLIADIMCTDEATANTIKEKLKREVSCGYDYVMKKGAKGFEQTQIRGNHLALVENGRAGQKAAIQDSKPDAIIKQNKKGDTNIMKKNLLGKMFAAWAKDADPEEVEQAINAMGSDEEPEVSSNQGGGGIEEVKKDVADLKAAMAECVTTLKQLVESDKKVHEGLSDEDKLDNLTKDDLADPDDEEADAKEQEELENLIEAEETESDEEPAVVAASGVMDTAMKSIVKAMKPVLLSIPDEKARTKAVDAFVSAAKDAMFPKSGGKNDYATLAKAVKSNVVKASDNRPRTMDQRRSEQVNTINKYNPHLKKEGK